MATKLDQSELVTFKELLLSNSIQIDAAVQLLIDKGLITKQEFFTKLKQVQAQYQAKRND
jgi:mannitol/fructose-specific phosphotransferase system IIA component (Ntr-type)